MKRIAKTFGGGLTSLSVIGAITLFGACSPEFEDCVETRSCAAAEAQGGDGSGASAGADNQGGSADAGADHGGAGNAGESATVGGAGGGEPAPCVEHGDCDDGLFCNGIEQCDEEGVCMPGTAPCNAEPDHCDATCEEGEFAEDCSYTAKDLDGDGHGTPECSLNAGDDCNDSPADGDTIYPGAPELCNGTSQDVDEDCDGNTEANDEVLLAGSTEILVPADGTSRRDHVSIAVNGDSFGVVWADWRDPDGSMIYYRSLASNGTAGAEALVETDATLLDQVYPDLAPVGAEFGIAFNAYDNDFSQQRIHYAEITPTGVTVTDKAFVAISAGAPQRSPTATYYLGTGLQRCAPSCATVDAGAEEFNVARESDRVVYTEAGDLWVSENGSAPTKQYDGDDASSPLISFNAVAFRTASGMVIDGCTFPDGIPVDFTTIDLAAPFDGDYVLYWNPARTALYVRVFTDDCSNFNASALVAEEDGTSIESAAMALALSAGTVAVVWSERDTTSNAWTIKRRIFGGTLCE